MKNLITALLKARKRFKPIKKEKINPYYKSKYADLDSVLSAVEEALLEAELAITQTTAVKEGQPVLVTTLWHCSGESISGEYYLPRNDDPQKLGAAMTYARRYALCAILSVTADEDDDGNSAMKSKPAYKAIKPHKKGEISREEWLAKHGRP